MNLRAARKVIEDLEEAVKKESEKASQNNACFWIGCNDTPIHSHVISKKLLRRIAENGEVLTWPSTETSFSDMADALDTGKPLERLNEEPVLVGIGDVEKVTYPLFCQPHDERVFAPIERKEIASRADRIPKQVLLLAYRALCSLSVKLSTSPIDIILEVAKKHGYQHSLSEPERYARLHRFLAKDIMLAVYKRHEQIRLTRDYSQLGYSLYVVNVPPCIATTYSLVPVDDNDAKAITNGTLALIPEDAISFSFLPHEPLTNSICVISWLKGSQRAQRFMHEWRINALPEKEQQDLFFSFAFESSTIYMSPTWWWHSLSAEKREEYTNIHFNAAREHAALV